MSIVVGIILLVFSALGSYYMLGSGEYYRYKRKVYVATLLMALAGLLIQISLFGYTLGTTLGANDEAKMWRDISDSVSSGSVFGFSAYKYPLYAFVYRFPLVALNIDSVSELYPKLVSLCMLFPTVAVLLNWSLQSWAPRLPHFLLTSILIANPLVVYYYCSSVRDPMVCLLFVCSVYMMFRGHWIALPLLFALALVRVETAMVLLVAFSIVRFVGLLHGLKKGYVDLNLIMVFILVAVLGVAFVSQKQVGPIEYVSKAFQTYRSIDENNLSEEGMTARLKTLPEPLSSGIMFAYTGIGTFPPWLQLNSPFLKSRSVDGVMPVRSSWTGPMDPGRILKFLGVGVWFYCVWLVITTMVLQRLRVSGRLKFVEAFDRVGVISVCLVYIFIHSLFTYELGKIMVVMPLVGVVAVLGLAYEGGAWKKTASETFKSCFAAYALLAGIYLSLKMA